MGHGMLVWSLPDHYPFPQTTLPRYLTGEAGAAWEGPWINLDTFYTDLKAIKGTYFEVVVPPGEHRPHRLACCAAAARDRGPPLWRLVGTECLVGQRHACLPPSCIAPQVTVIARRPTAKTTLANPRARRRSCHRRTLSPTTLTPRAAAAAATEPRAVEEEATALGRAGTTRRAPGTPTAAAPRCPAAPSLSTCRP